MIMMVHMQFACERCGTHLIQSHAVGDKGAVVQSCPKCGDVHTITIEHKITSFKKKTPYIPWEVRQNNKRIKEMKARNKDLMKIANCPNRNNGYDPANHCGLCEHIIIEEKK